MQRKLISGNWKKTAMWIALILLVTPYIIYLVPQYLGTDAYIVDSGSMTPEMPTGSVVFEKWSPTDELEEGDVIIFRPNQSNTDEEVITHRIVDTRTGNYTKFFKTKGDANPRPDPGWTPGYRVIGERVFWVPYIGYFIALTKSLPFMFLLVLIPAAILIRGQVKNILDEWDKEEKDEKDTDSERIPVGEKESKQRIAYKDQ